MVGKTFRRWLAGLSLLAIPAVLLLTFGGSAAAGSAGKAAPVTSSSLGSYSPTFTGPAATGCASGCNLLTGPYTVAAINPASSSNAATAAIGSPDRAKALPWRLTPLSRAHLGASQTATMIPDVTCVPLSAGCDSINTTAAGAVGVKGLDAVDSARHTKNIYKDVEPPDQAACAGNGYAVEANNIGEMKVFNTALTSSSVPVSLDNVMGLRNLGWSSGGDPGCLYDHSNGGHWFFTEIVSTSTEQSGGAFTGCFSAKPNACKEGIAVTTGNSPYGPYKVYFLNADYNPSEPGSPYLLNDFAKIAVSRDAFLLFYDEFPLNGPTGFGGGFFNGAQEMAFTKNALEQGQHVTMPNGSPNPALNVSIMNMGLVPTPDGTCANDNTYHEGGVTCWYSVIPAMPPDPADFDNSHGGSAFMLDTLDFYGTSDNRLAVWDYTGLSNLDSPGCSSCSGIKFAGQMFSGTNPYYDPAGLPSGVVIPQKAGPIPLGNECGRAGLSSSKSCPENGLATNGDNITQASQANGQLWASNSTEVQQEYASNANGTESHMGVAYWVVGTSSFDSGGNVSLTNQGYVSPAHEDLTMPAIAGEGKGGNGKAVLTFTLAGNGGPTGADGGGFYPSTAYATLASPTATPSTINIADAGQSPQDGFTEYQGYPGGTRERWGDYSAAVYLPGSGGRIYFANEYIQSPNCAPPAFTLSIGTCGGTRDGFANWGTSMNYVVP